MAHLFNNLSRYTISIDYKFLGTGSVLLILVVEPNLVALILREGHVHSKHLYLTKDHQPLDLESKLASNYHTTTDYSEEATARVT